MALVRVNVRGGVGEIWILDNYLWVVREDRG
jgi:hypothetical protein